MNTKQKLLGIALLVAVYQMQPLKCLAQPIEVLSLRSSDNAYLCALSLGTSEAFKLRYSWVVSTDELDLSQTQKTNLIDAIDRADGLIGDDPVPTPTGPNLPTIPELAKKEIAVTLKPLNLRVVLKRGRRVIATCAAKPKSLQTGQSTSTDSSGVSTTTTNIFLPVGSPATKASHRCKTPSGKVVNPTPSAKDSFALVQRTSSAIRKGSFKKCPDTGCRSSFFCGTETF